MSFYWICMGDPAGVQPVLQPLINGPVLSPKLTPDFMSGQMMCSKVINPSPFFVPTDIKSNCSNMISVTQPKQDTSRHYHIFVGDLGPDVETHQLREAFAPFGQTTDCKIIRDQQTLKSKGYGFVSFVNKEDAENAICCMNGQWIGSRAIRTNWATRKPPAPNQKEALQKPLSYEEVYNQASTTNCTVYCGGIINGLTEELIHKSFNVFGCIQEIRVFKEKGYAFIRFSTKESATQAIVALHGTEINGQVVKCSWGKEPNESPTSSPTQQLTPVTLQSIPFSSTTGANNAAALLQSNQQQQQLQQAAAAAGYYNQQQQQQLGAYWATYPPGAAAAAAAATLSQPHLSAAAAAAGPGAYLHQQPCAAVTPNGYSYGFSRLPATVQWQTGTAGSVTNAPTALAYGPHQPAILAAYPTQQGYQHA